LTPWHCFLKVNDNESLLTTRLDLRRSASAGQLRSSDTLSAGQLLAANLSLNHLHPGHAAGDARPIIIVQSCCGGHSRCRF
jgi:hypothetical protein